MSVADPGRRPAPTPATGGLEGHGGEAGGGAAELARLRARVAGLERERRRAFEDAQREADSLFAQYQLSQLVASGGSVAELGSAVLLELLRLAGAAGAALYLGASGDAAVERIATVGATPRAAGAARDARDGGGIRDLDGAGEVPTAFTTVDAARAWIATVDGGRVVGLSEADPPLLVAVWPHPGRALDEDGLRIAQLARHELAVAFAGARLRAALEQERHDLGAIVDGATDLIVQVDATDRVVRLNVAGERLLGIEAPEALGRTCAEVLGCEVAGGHATADCPLAAVRAGGDPIGYRETAVQGADGRPVRVAGSYTATAGAAGTGARATAILRDITAVRALEELREGFVATVSHELRTPLALIRGYAESLLHLDLDEAERRRYVERIDDASGRLATLVDEVLDVTHLQADPLILERAPTTFATLVARLRGELEIAGGAERLEVDAPEDLPPADIDIRRVGQVLTNLVGNARKYAADDSAVVVGASVDGPWLAITVDDAGVGIPEAERGLVTEPFHRAWNVRESRIPGTGLGLFICRRLVEAHGGRLSIHDRPDGRTGTRIRFTLPLAAPESLDG